MTDAEIIKRAIGKLVFEQVAPAELLGVDVTVVNGLYALGCAASAQGRHVMADNVFQRCVRLDPYRAEFWIGLAVARQAQGRVDEAGEVYQIAGLMTDDVAPVAYAAACFAEAGQSERARLLAEYVRERAPSRSDLDAWLDVACAATSAAGES